MSQAGGVPEIIMECYCQRGVTMRSNPLTVWMAHSVLVLLGTVHKAHMMHDLCTHSLAWSVHMVQDEFVLEAGDSAGEANCGSLNNTPPPSCPVGSLI